MRRWPVDGGVGADEEQPRVGHATWELLDQSGDDSETSSQHKQSEFNLNCFGTKMIRVENLCPRSVLIEKK